MNHLVNQPLFTGVARLPTNGSETVFTAHFSDIDASLDSFIGLKRADWTKKESRNHSAAVIYLPIRTMNTAGAMIPISGTKTCGNQFTAKSLVIGYINRSLVSVKIEYL